MLQQTWLPADLLLAPHLSPVKPGGVLRPCKSIVADHAILMMIQILCSDSSAVNGLSISAPTLSASLSLAMLRERLAVTSDESNDKDDKAQMSDGSTLLFCGKSLTLFLESVGDLGVSPSRHLHCSLHAPVLRSYVRSPLG